MEQFQKMDVAFGVESHIRSYVIHAESGITLIYDLAKIVGGYLFGRNVEGEDVEGQFLERSIFPFRLPVWGQRGNLFGNEETSVLGQSLEDDILEGETIRSSPGAQISLRRSVCRHCGR